MKKSKYSAFYEAGHTVIAIIKDIPVVGVTIVEDGPYGGGTHYKEITFKRRNDQKKYAYSRIVASYAGFWVSLKNIGEDNRAIVDFTSSHDFASAQNMAQWAYPKRIFIQTLFIDKGEKEAQELVNTLEVWKTIAQLAKVLEEKKTMTIDEVQKLVDPVIKKN